LAGVVIVAAFGGAWACSQADMPPPLGTPDAGKKDSTSPSDASSDSPGACLAVDGGCNTLSNCGAQVNIVEIASNAPDAAGGLVIDGTYELTDYKVFTGSGGKTGTLTAWFRQTMMMTSVTVTDAGVDAGDAGQVMSWLEVSATNASTTTTSSGTLILQPPSALTIDYSCPTLSIGQPFIATFTANATQVIIFAGDSNGTGQLTYTKH
jgi:hypothetical protein